ncbi:T9SS type A sorting domain-containing protein [Balneolales bacterium ANBcel1]|nr:T9SS type A sorting domain-containing protein [Balneolales bacterium ANBcel1]
MVIIGLKSVRSQDIYLELLEEIKGEAGQVITIEFTISDLEDLEVRNFDIHIAFDPELIDVHQVTDGPVIQSGSIFKNITEDHRIKLSYASVNKLKGDGVLFRIDATLIATGVNPQGMTINRLDIGEPGRYVISPQTPHNIPVVVGTNSSIVNESVQNENKQNKLVYHKGNYPNPFNPHTTITYHVENQAHVLIRIYNSAGQLVSTLINETQSAGTYSIPWNASGLNSGLFITEIIAINEYGAKSRTTDIMTFIK